MNDCKQQVIIIANYNNESRDAVDAAMKQLAESGHVVKTCHTTDQGYDLTYVQNDRGGEPIHVSNLKNCEISKNVHIKTFEFEEIIQELSVKMNDYLEHFVPRKVRVMVDEVWEKTDQSKPNSCWKAKIKRASAEYNNQTGIEYIITLRRFYESEWSEAQLVACLFDLLSLIQEDGSIRKRHIDDANPLVATFGSKFLEPGVCIDNLLEGNVDLKIVKKASKAQQEATFDEDGNLENTDIVEEGPQDDEPEELITH